jgi:hypothetical protein
MQHMGNRPSGYDPFIHILDDDSLLIIFNFYRPILINEDENDDQRILQGGNWARERWWYRLAQVCQRWRHLILASASYLDLCLVCTHGTPVADMLAQSSPLPLIIDYLDEDPVTADDEEGVVLALQHRNRVRRIRIQMPGLDWPRLALAIDGEFPMLEYLYLGLLSEYLILPETFQTPQLRHVVTMGIGFPTPLLSRHVSLVTLSLQNMHPSAYLSPEDLLPRLSLMPHLETLLLSPYPPYLPWGFFSGTDRQLQLLPTQITPTVTLPNLRWFGFGGLSSYLEALLFQINAPLLEKVQILFLTPLRFRFSCLLQFMSAAENLRFGSAKFRFYDKAVDAWVYPRKGAKMYSFYMQFSRFFLSEQVLSTAEFFGALGTVFSAVEHLDLESECHVVSLRYPTLWRDLLGSFGGAKSLVVGHRLAGEISRSFRLDEGESATEFLPKLKEMSYPATGGEADDAFIAFADARRIAGCPVTLSRL